MSAHITCTCAQRDTGRSATSAFRDYLRAHSSKAAAYGDLKRGIAAQYRFDNLGYMHAKDGFVKTTLLEARSWYELREKAPLDVRA